MIRSPRLNWSTAHYPGKIQADRPDGYWRMNELAGTVIRDYSAQHHDGDAYMIPGYGHSSPLPSDVCLYFDGTSNAWIGVVPASSYFYDGHPMTLEIWSNFVNLPEGAYNDFFAQRDYGAGLGGYHLTVVKGQDAILFELTSGTPANFDVATGSTAVVNGSWYQIVGSYDGNTMVLYLNGHAIGSTSGASLGEYNEPLSIAGNPTSGVGTVDGYYAEAAIYPYALSAKTVLDHYNLRSTSLFA